MHFTLISRLKIALANLQPTFWAYFLYQKSIEKRQYVLAVFARRDQDETFSSKRLVRVTNIRQVCEKHEVRAQIWKSSKFNLSRSIDDKFLKSKNNVVAKDTIMTRRSLRWGR